MTLQAAQAALDNAFEPHQAQAIMSAIAISHADHFALVHQRFDRMDARFDSIDAKLGTLDRRIEEVNDSLARRLDRQDDDIRRLLDEQSALRVTLARLDTTTSERMSKIEARITDLPSKGFAGIVLAVATCGSAVALGASKILTELGVLP